MSHRSDYILSAVVATIVGGGLLTFAGFQARSYWWPNISARTVRVQTVVQLPGLYRLEAVVALDDMHNVIIDTNWRGANPQRMLELGAQALVGKMLRVAVSPDRSEAVWKQPSPGPVGMTGVFMLTLAFVLWIGVLSQREWNQDGLFLLIGIGFFLIGVAMIGSHYLSAGYGWTTAEARVADVSLFTTNRGRNGAATEYLNLVYAYDVGGRSLMDGASLDGSQRLSNLPVGSVSPRIGDSILIRIDPVDPQRTIVVTDLSWFVYAWTVGTAFLSLLGYWGVRTDRSIEVSRD
jgi:hypothetical protein